MSNLSLVKGQPQEVSGSLAIRNMDDLSRLAKMLNQSGYFKDAKDAAQCGTKILAGLEMGFGAFASMTGIHIIQGKPAAGANLMAAAVKRHPKYNYRVREMSKEICRIEFFENGESCGISEFTRADASAAKTQNMDKFARNMLFARAMSNGVRWFCPDVFDAPIYTPEELGAGVDGDGNLIEASVVEQPKLQPTDDDPRLASASQKKMLMTIAKNNNWSKEARHLALETFGVDSIKSLPADKVDDMKAILEDEETRRDFEMEATESGMPPMDAITTPSGELD